ncbi:MULTISPECIES: hypothetical protein [unclassified Photobacterium]|uniref:hypothetical protein n=1 Tax=unclassified Photobacterium TaxID=2628852 RepID=UPI0011B21982|nr:MULTISPECIES: hypothetical protein [unclassified Photobacterium]
MKKSSLKAAFLLPDSYRFISFSASFSKTIFTSVLFAQQLVRDLPFVRVVLARNFADKNTLSFNNNGLRFFGGLCF